MDGEEDIAHSQVCNPKGLEIRDYCNNGLAYESRFGEEIWKKGTTVLRNTCRADEEIRMWVNGSTIEYEMGLRIIIT